MVVLWISDGHFNLVVENFIFFDDTGGDLN